MTARLKQTPWQTVGPYFHYSLTWKGAADLVEGAGDLGARLDLVPAEHDLLGSGGGQRKPAQGQRIEIYGAVSDGDGQPVPDALLEIWQCNSSGRYASADDTREDIPLDPSFTGFGRAATGQDGLFRFRTVRPGRAPGPGNTWQAPHVVLSLMGRGLLKRLVTRIYFEDEPSNEDDPILNLVLPDRRRTLIARRDGSAWRFDIHLQGERETVFFEV